jgi:oligosaccharyltransferase complex subunit alpha (ribophorin I)
MRWLWLTVVVASAAAAVLGISAAAAAVPTFTQTVARTLDLTSQLVRETVTITLEQAADASAPTTTYRVETPDAARLAFVQVKTKGASGVVLPLTEVQHAAGTPPSAWTVQLASPLAVAGDKTVLVLSLVYIHKLAPVPARAPLLAPQFVRLDHLLHFYSPYPSARERTAVTLPSGATVKGRTDGGETSADPSKITYGPYTDVPAADADELYVHYENNAAFAVVTRLERTLEVSHWGSNLAVEEFFDVEHQGAGVDGPFSRLDLMLRGPSQLERSNLLTNFVVPIPLTATDIYYRDVIGNISTSTLRPNLARGVINLDLEPRYPLVGGWKTSWYHGWNEPLASVLSRRTDRPGYVLRVPLATLFDHAAVDRFILRVTLPEGAHNLQLHTDVPMDDLHLTTTKTYLDSYGRPVLVASRARVVNEHNGPIYVRVPRGA